jgi:hypothetical protein
VGGDKKARLFLYYHPAAGDDRPVSNLPLFDAGFYVLCPGVVTYPNVNGVEFPVFCPDNGIEC